ncbi:hypothetical protein PVAG01_01138 [Phlyctema vagabunda]|uniref:Uncharacterized protein n=1 Tax=Phlyctema vagabunda TaxID=108571 RepID=A0ABR4PWH1_9HELO
MSRVRLAPEGHQTIFLPFSSSLSKDNYARQVNNRWCGGLCACNRRWLQKLSEEVNCRTTGTFIGTRWIWSRSANLA